MSHSTGQSTGNRGWRPEIRALVDALSGVMTHSRRLHRAWTKSERLFAAWESPGSGEDHFWSEPEISPAVAIPALKDERREAIKRLPVEQRNYASQYETLFWSVFHWREAIAQARTALPHVARFTNDQRDPEVSQWTSRMRRELDNLNGFICPFREGDIPFIGNGVPPGFLEGLGRIRDLMSDLKSTDLADQDGIDRVPDPHDSAPALEGTPSTSESQKERRGDVLQESSGRFYKLAWYQKKTDGALYTTLLRRAIHRDRLVARKSGNLWQAEFESVCQAYPEYSGELRSAAGLA